MEVESVLVTGANRGIGLEFVNQLVKLAKPPRFVFATYRDEKTTEALKEIREASKKVHVELVKLDITKKDDIESSRKAVESQVGDRGLNLLINNAGALKYQGFLDISEDNMLSHFTTNTVGPVMVLKEFLPLLQKSAAHKTSGMGVSRAAVLNLSSVGGSIGLLSNDLPKELLTGLSYGTSKTALNMAMRVAALTVKDQGILIVNMCPGWVKTDMGCQESLLAAEETVLALLNNMSGVSKQEGMMTVEQSVSSMLNALPQLNESHHGAFLDRNGKTIPF